MMKTPTLLLKTLFFVFISYNKIKECFNLNLRFSIYRFHGRFHGCVIDRFYGRFGFGPKPRLKNRNRTEPNRPFTSLLTFDYILNANTKVLENISINGLLL